MLFRSGSSRFWPCPRRDWLSQRLRWSALGNIRGWLSRRLRWSALGDILQLLVFTCRSRAGICNVFGTRSWCTGMFTGATGTFTGARGWYAGMLFQQLCHHWALVVHCYGESHRISIFQFVLEDSRCLYERVLVELCTLDEAIAVSKLSHGAHKSISSGRVRASARVLFHGRSAGAADHLSRWTDSTLRQTRAARSSPHL